jgi:hypothetical protein
LAAILNIAGGARYHVRGWISAKTRWQPFRGALATWLARWQPAGGKLVIVGASGGY